MNTFESEIMKNFGVKLRSREQVLPDQNFQTHQYVGRPISMGGYPTQIPLPVSRYMYLPREQSRASNQVNSMAVFRPDIDGSDNWQMGYRQCQYKPGNAIWSQGNGKKTNERRLFSKKKQASAMKRSHSFSQVSFPPSEYLPFPTEQHSQNPLLSHKTRSLSASQTSLASNLSKFSLKLGKVFGSKSKLEESSKQYKSIEKQKRQLPIPQDTDMELPYFSFHRAGHKQADYPGEAHLPDILQQTRGLEKHPSFNPFNRVDQDVGRDPDEWFSKDHLFKDHISEVIGKWKNIDDEIWAKVIIFERNRRIAKAYARSAVLTINGSNTGFNGLNIGLNGFENPKRDPEVAGCKGAMGQGCKLKMTDNGDILIKRVGRGKVFVQNTLEEAAVSNDILKLYSGLLEPGVAMKLFDMNKFKQNMNRELKRQRPDRGKLEKQCISCFSFVQKQPDLLESPIWIMLLNIVALEMMHARVSSKRTDNGLDSAGFSSESSSGVNNRSKNGSTSDYYSGLSAWTRGADGRRESRCGRRRLPVPKTEVPFSMYDLDHRGRKKYHTDC